MSKEEFDVSEAAWEAYKLMYSEKLEEKLDLDSIGSKTGRKPVSTRFKYHTNSSKEINFSGETDFNFTRGFAYSRLECYKKQIECSPSTREYSKYFDLLGELTHSIVNISLMPQTGNLQGVKQGIGNDRLDTFIWVLSEYYSGSGNLLFNHSSFANIQPLKSYLDIFDDIYGYCEAIYHIKKPLVDKLICSGREALDSPERVVYFIGLAVEFWRQKLDFLIIRKQALNDEVAEEFERQINSISDDLKKFPKISI